MQTKTITQILVTRVVLLLSFLAFSSSLLAYCDITQVNLTSTTCEADGSYTLCIELIGQDLPASPGNLKLVIEHQPVDISGIDYQLTAADGSKASICVNLANNNYQNVELYVQVESGCSFTKYSFYDEPDCSGPPPCSINSITASTPACLWYDVYEVILYVEGENFPQTDDKVRVKVEGELVGVNSYIPSADGTSAEIKVTVTKDNRQDVRVRVRLEGGCAKTVQALFDEPDCGDEPVCTLSSITAGTPACLWYDVYEIEFTLIGENLPLSDQGVRAWVDGTEYQVTHYETTNSSETEAIARVTVLRDLAQDVDVTIELGSGCSLTAYDLYDEPDCGDEPICSLTGITAGTPACLYYDVYEVEFTLTGENLPLNDQDVRAWIDGTEYQVTHYETTNSSETEAIARVTVLRDLAQDVDVTIEVGSGCSLTVYDLYDEPDCGDEPICNLTGITSGTPSCLYYDVYEVEFTLTGENLPLSGQNVRAWIDGTEYQVTRYETTNSSETEAIARVTVLRDLAQDVDVTIEVGSGCSLTVYDLYDEPDCGDQPVCSLTGITAATPACLWYDVYEVVFTLTGENLPLSDQDVRAWIDGTEYQVTRYETTNSSETEAEMRVTVLRDLAQDVDVTIELKPGCSLTVQDLYDEPDCGDEPSSRFGKFASNDFKLYPNPNQGQFRIEAPGFEKGQVVVFNSMGQQVYAGSMTGSATDINMTSMDAGVYVVQVRGKEGVMTKKMVLE